MRKWLTGWVVTAFVLTAAWAARCDAQTVQVTPLSPALPKACWPDALLRGSDTMYRYVPCRSLDVLPPGFRKAVECTLARQRKGAWQPLVQETYRSDYLQGWYFKQGRTRPGPRITNASSSRTSTHGYALGVDIISATKGWNDPKFFYWLGQHAEACGLVAGVFWKRFPDGPHIQTGAWDGAPPAWARLLVPDSLPVVWRRTGNAN